ncbi:uncharacterized protein LOC143301994 [Babylonia areolata]|uniref:uncharacterized protein LOC143301994 n=1 Tax=Babylonia areolata TaxID=304850 RepID=UPI003FD39099
MWTPCPWFEPSRAASAGDVSVGTHLINGGKDVVTLTYGGRHLKVYSLATGKVIAMMRQTEPKLRQILGVTVNEQCTVAAADMDQEEYMLIFDLRQRQHMQTIRPPDLLQESVHLAATSLTSDGRFLLTTGEKTLREDEYDDDSRGRLVSETVVKVFDLEKRHCHALVDSEAFWRYKRDPGCDLDTYCSSFRLLDSVRVLSSHDDNILRVFDLHSGEMLMRLEGHEGSPNIYSGSPNAPVVLTHGNYSQENGFRLWTKEDLKPLASFSLDDEVEDFLLLGDHCSPIVANAKEREDPVLFHLHCPDSNSLPGNHAPLTSYPEVYKGKKMSHVIAGLTIDEGVDDDNDPDDDRRVETDSDSGLDNEDDDDDDDYGNDDDDDDDDDIDNLTDEERDHV